MGSKYEKYQNFRWSFRDPRHLTISLKSNREEPFNGEGVIQFPTRTYDRTCGCFDKETGIFTAQQRGVYGQDFS